VYLHKQASSKLPSCYRGGTPERWSLDLLFLCSEFWNVLATVDKIRYTVTCVDIRTMLTHCDSESSHSTTTPTKSTPLNMLPAFGDEWKRKINLGGVSSAATQSSILNQVQAERQARAQHKHRTENAIRIQAWYRGVRDARITKMEMRREFEADVMGLTGLRCLVLIGRDDDVQGKWSRAILELGPGSSCFHVLF